MSADLKEIREKLAPFDGLVAAFDDLVEQHAKSNKMLLSLVDHGGIACCAADDGHLPDCPLGNYIAAERAAGRWDDGKA